MIKRRLFDGYRQDQIYDLQGHRFYIGNYSKCHEIFFQAVITEGQFDYMHIDPDPAPSSPYDMFEYNTLYAAARPSLVGHYFSMYSDDFRDLSDFWEFVNKMKQQPEWAVWYSLAAGRLD